MYKKLWKTKIEYITYSTTQALHNMQNWEQFRNVVFWIVFNLWFECVHHVGDTIVTFHFLLAMQCHCSTMTTDSAWSNILFATTTQAFGTTAAMFMAIAAWMAFQATASIIDRVQTFRGWLLAITRRVIMIAILMSIELMLLRARILAIDNIQNCYFQSSLGVVVLASGSFGRKTSSITVITRVTNGWYQRNWGFCLHGWGIARTRGTTRAIMVKTLSKKYDHQAHWHFGDLNNCNNLQRVQQSLGFLVGLEWCYIFWGHNNPEKFKWIQWFHS